MGMFQFVMRSDKKREKWQFLSEEEVAAINPPPMFTTALSLTANPKEVAASGGDPNTAVKYYGPMHFDLDNADDIPSALDSGRELFKKIQVQLGIPPDYISIFLSGKKGLHFTIPATVFGIAKPVPMLPLIWKYVAERMRVEDLDMSIYSMGNGRMWRNANVQRKEGTYKVQVTPEELENMDEEQYLTLVAAPRIDLPVGEPSDKFTSAAAATMFREGRKHARQVINKMAESSAKELENAEELPEVPGCIHKLITEGDCPESNYNQAGMQLAAWIAARFKREDEARYNELLVEPFLENVLSATRPSLSERREHIKNLLNRAFHGNIAFSRAATISTVGVPCHNCPICRPDLFEAGRESDSEEDHFDPETRIKEDDKGYWRVSNTSITRLTSFHFVPHTQYNRMVYEQGVLTETVRLGMIGTLIDDKGFEKHDVQFPEDAWSSKSSLTNMVSKGIGTAVVMCSDADLSLIQRAVMEFYPLESLAMTTYTETCGFYLERLSTGDCKPHYVEAENAVSSFGVPSRFKYTGAKSHVPTLLSIEPLSSEDTDAVECIESVTRMNEGHSMALIIGWLASNYFREHINFNIPEYPSINVSGSSGAGKSATTRLLCKLSGIDYNRAGSEPLNLEASSMVPLHQYMSTSTTVVRVVEEANEAQMKRSAWNSWTNIVKSAWDRTSVSRGMLGTKGNGPGRVDYRISAPLLFISEQRPVRPAVQERCISVLLSKRGRSNPDCRAAFLKAMDTSDSLYKVGRKLMDIAMVSDPAQFTKQALDQQFGDYVPNDFDDRPRFSFLVTFLGLSMLRRAYEEAGLTKGVLAINKLENDLVIYLANNCKELSSTKRISECDIVLRSLNAIAGDPDARSKVRPIVHYTRVGNDLKLHLDQMLPVYRRFCQETNTPCMFRLPEQLGELLRSEPYFDRMEPDEKTGIDSYVIDIRAAQSHGIPLSHFKEVVEA